MVKLLTNTTSSAHCENCECSLKNVPTYGAGRFCDCACARKYSYRKQHKRNNYELKAIIKKHKNKNSNKKEKKTVSFATQLTNVKLISPRHQEIDSLDSLHTLDTLDTLDNFTSIDITTNHEKDNEFTFITFPSTTEPVSLITLSDSPVSSIPSTQLEFEVEESYSTMNQQQPQLSIKYDHPLLYEYERSPIRSPSENIMMYYPYSMLPITDTCFDFENNLSSFV